MFHVETTAWEGEHAWQLSRTTTLTSQKSGEESALDSKAAFAKYGSYFWSDK